MRPCCLAFHLSCFMTANRRTGKSVFKILYRHDGGGGLEVEVGGGGGVE